MDIKIRPVYWQKTGTEFDYVGIAEPHFLVNVYRVKDGKVMMWTQNAFGQISYSTLPVDLFHKTYKRRVSDG